MRFTFQAANAAADRRKLRALNWTDERLDELAEVGVEDLDDMRRWWQERAPAQWQNLLEAEPVDELNQ